MDLIARKAFKYNGQHLAKGEPFRATDRYGALFVRVGLAERPGAAPPVAKNPTPPVPAPKPTPPPPTHPPAAAKHPPHTPPKSSPSAPRPATAPAPKPPAAAPAPTPPADDDEKARHTYLRRDMTAEPEA